MEEKVYMAFRFNFKGLKIRNIASKIKTKRATKRRVKAEKVKAVESQVNTVRETGRIDNLGRIKLSRSDLRKLKAKGNDPVGKLSQLVAKYHSLPEHSVKRIALKTEIEQLSNALKNSDVATKYQGAKLKNILKAAAAIIGVTAVGEALDA